MWLYIGIPFPSPLCMWVRLFHPKKKKKLEKVLLGLFDLIQSIQYTLALFGPYWSYCVHFGLIQSPSVLFGPLLIPFCPLWFNSVHFSPIRSKLVLFDPVCPLQSYLVHSGPFCPLRSYSVHLFLFSPIQFPSVLFGPPCFYLVLFCPFGPLCCIRSIWPIWSILDHFDLFLCTYKIGKDIFRLKEKLVFFTINTISIFYLKK